MQLLQQLVMTRLSHHVGNRCRPCRHKRVAMNFDDMSPPWPCVVLLLCASIHAGRSIESTRGATPCSAMFTLMMTRLSRHVRNPCRPEMECRHKRVAMHVDDMSPPWPCVILLLCASIHAGRSRDFTPTPSQPRDVHVDDDTFVTSCQEPLSSRNDD